MGKANDEKRTPSNEFKQLLLPEEKRNYILCSSTSSIKDSSNSSISNSISASPASTTSQLSEYSSNDIKSMKSRSAEQQSDEKIKTINIKENKLNKENYVLLLNDLEHLKNYHSSPSTKSSSINSLNQLIKPSIDSTNLPRPINRSLTFIDQKSLDKGKYAMTSQQTKQYFKQSNDNKPYCLAKSASTQSQNLATYESNLPQSYSAVFNDKYTADRQYAGLDNQTSANPCNNSIDNQLKISFKDAFCRKWFLNKFRTDNEFDFEQGTKNKKPKLINLKRYSLIDLSRENLDITTEPVNSRQTIFADKSNDSLPSTSGVQVKRSDDKNHLRSDLKIQQITNPLHPFYLNAVNCADTWTADESNIIDRVDENLSVPQLTNYPTLVCSKNRESMSSTDIKQINRLPEPQSNSNHQNNIDNKNSNKKLILLPKLHNEYCTNTNSSHHHHHNHNENSSNGSTTRSSSTNSSNVSTSSSTADNKAVNTLKPVNNELSGSLSSVSSADVHTDPMLPICKICHLNGKEEDPLISPCRCSGTMQYIHCRCLMRWLEISKKKSRKPLRCELCQYEYEWKKKFKVGNWQFPKCSRLDIYLHVAFIISVIIMICCALSIIVFFKLQEIPRMSLTRSDLTINEPIIVVLAMVFVFSFCLSLYAQVKARTTLYRLISNFIYLNQNWYINEYEAKKSSTAKEVAEIV